VKKNGNMLFGVFATHSPESCPINNESSKKIFMEMKEKMDIEMRKYNITRVVEFYMSVLEHQWIIIIDAVHAHDIEQLCIDDGISSMSTVKIVPINLYEDTLKKFESN
jgi:translation initiation factor 6 (eIF-6)